MRILVNGTYVGKPSSGVPRAAASLTSALARHHDLEITVAVRSASALDATDGLRQSVAPRWAANSQLFEQVALPLMFRRGHYDLLLNLTNVVVAAVPGESQVVAIYDLAPIRHQHYFSWLYQQKFRIMMRLIQRKQPQVITFSCQVAHELKETLHIRASALQLGKGLLIPLSDPAADLSVTGAPFCLAHGASDGRKRVADLIAIWPTVYRSLGLTLVILNPPSATHRAALGSDAPLPAGVTILNRRLTDAEYRSTLSAAACLLSASEYEGASLAADEALSVGTPVVVSDIPVYRELLQDRASYFESLENLPNVLRATLSAPRPSPMSQDEVEASWDASASSLKHTLLVPRAIDP